MTKKEILEAAEANAMNYCIQRGMAKAAFIDGALWAMKYCKEVIKSALEAEDVESLWSRQDVRIARIIPGQ